MPAAACPFAECHVLTGPALLQQGRPLVHFRNSAPWCCRPGPSTGRAAGAGMSFIFYKLNYEFLKHRLEPGARGCALVGHGRRWPCLLVLQAADCGGHHLLVCRAPPGAQLWLCARFPAVAASAAGTGRGERACARCSGPSAAPLARCAAGAVAGPGPPSAVLRGRPLPWGRAGAVPVR